VAWYNGDLLKMPATEPDSFFNKKRNTSEIKSEVLIKFFNEWYRIYLKGEEEQQAKTLLYIDLYAGPGYTEEEKTTAPIRIVESIYNKDTSTDLSPSIRTFFSDPANTVAEKLKVSFESLEYFAELKNPPLVLNEEANRQTLSDSLHASGPALIVSDPFGYEYSQQVLLNGMEQENTDLFLLFNANRIRSVMQSDKEDQGVAQLLGNSMDEIRNYITLEGSSKKREAFVVSKLEEALDVKGYYNFSFKIVLPDKDQTSHYLIMASKAKETYFLMKEFMHKYSDVQEDGVPLFSANQRFQQPSIPGFYKSLNKFCMENLIEDLAGRRSQYHYLTIKEIFEIHSVGTNYIRTNYRNAFEKLREEGRISIVDINNRKVSNISSDSLVFYKFHGRFK
jgi:three-Cys-motif partner protein